LRGEHLRSFRTSPAPPLFTLSGIRYDAFAAAVPEPDEAPAAEDAPEPDEAAGAKAVVNSASSAAMSAILLASVPSLVRIVYIWVVSGVTAAVI
jgi:hypothetical protein